MGTVVRPELIRQVEMGPFKYVIDDGLDIRKAAYECMYTLLNAFLDRIDVFTFVEHMAAGLRDHSDIRMLCHLMLGRLAASSPAAMMRCLDIVSEALQTTITQVVKSTAVKQEIEKNDELVRSALRAVVTLARLPDAKESNPRFAALLAKISQDEALRERFAAAEGDTADGTGL